MNQSEKSLEEKKDECNCVIIWNLVEIDLFWKYLNSLLI